MLRIPGGVGIKSPILTSARPPTCTALLASGPMTNDAAIRFVDDRRSEARQRFDQLKGEMTGRSATANLARKDAGEM